LHIYLIQVKISSYLNIIQARASVEYNIFNSMINCLTYNQKLTNCRWLFEATKTTKQNTKGQHREFVLVISEVGNSNAFL